MATDLEKQDRELNLNADQLAEIKAVRGKLRRNGLASMADSVEIPNDIKIATAKALKAKEDLAEVSNLVEKFNAIETTLGHEAKTHVKEKYGDMLFDLAMSSIANGVSKDISVKSFELSDGGTLSAKYHVHSLDPDSKERREKIKLENDLQDSIENSVVGVGIRKLTDLLKFRMAGKMGAKSKILKGYTEQREHEEKGKFRCEVQYVYTPKEEKE